MLIASPTLRHGWSILACLVLLAISSLAQAADPKGFDPKRHLRVEEVEPGMTGYGMTVFHGTEPEPFRVEVVSVERGFLPGKSVVWVRCPDERMQLTGPVQGMSGSPIYLWAKGQEQEPGKGGRMLGAFAFGYRLGKDCYVGIQPISQMIEAGNRAKADAKDRKTSASGGAVRDMTLSASYQLADQLGLDEQQTWRLKALADLSKFRKPATGSGAATAASDLVARPNQLALPVTVGSSETAALLQPFLAPMGMAAQARSTVTSPLPPKWINPETTKLKPGSAFAIPLVTGPLDMSALGTTTEVLPDGTALAFGHQFFAEGDIAVPMATGFIHFIQPNISASFKIGGSLRVTGAVVRDEQVAVVGKPGATYPTVPAKVSIRWPDNSISHDYTYQMVHHDRLLPALLGAVVGSSLTSDTTLPKINTLSVRSDLQFAGGKKIKIDRLIPNGTIGQIAIAIVPALSVLMDNEFGKLEVTNIETTVNVADEVRGASLVSATLEQSAVKPGGKVVAHVRLKPYRGEEQLKRIEIKVPANVPDGMYALTIGGAQTYFQQRIAARPHLMYVENQNDLFKAVEMQLDIKDDALYAVLSLNPANNLALGRQELPHLPSSRLALMQVETSTRTTPYLESVEAIEPMPYVVLGATALPVMIKKDLNRDAE